MSRPDAALQEPACQLTVMVTLELVTTAQLVLGSRLPLGLM